MDNWRVVHKKRTHIKRNRLISHPITYFHQHRKRAAMSTHSLDLPGDVENPPLSDSQDQPSQSAGKFCLQFTECREASSTLKLPANLGRSSGRTFLSDCLIWIFSFHSINSRSNHPTSRQESLIYNPLRVFHSRLHESFERLDSATLTAISSFSCFSRVGCLKVPEQRNRS